ncbi:MAG TPA: rhomboid family intramembrane serine protease [Flavobacteriaceae bacterium]|nr:rhomboid family intramembrane serine protease [Flavobacteriaceae bacterium]
MGRITETVKALIIINIIFFVGAYLLGDRATALFALWFPQNPNFHIWELITHMFMHGGLMHILFNMFMLYMFGSILENYLGQKRFLFLYFSSGLGAAGLQILFSYFGFHSAFEAFVEAGMTPDQIYDMLAQGSIQYGSGIDKETATQLLNTYWTPMVGASGAIFGVLMAFAIVYPNIPLYIMFIPVPIKAKYLIGGYFLLNVFSAVTGISILGPANTAHWAHIGGAIIGFITMWMWKRDQFNQNRWN